MDNILIAQTFNQSRIRAETIIHLASAGEESPFFTDSLGADMEGILRALHMPLEEDEMKAETILWNCYNQCKLGFLVKLSSPVLDLLDNGDSAGPYSWEECEEQWFYAESLEEIYAQGVTWVIESDELARAEAKELG